MPEPTSTKEMLILDPSYTADRHGEYDIDQIVDTEDGTDVTDYFGYDEVIAHAIEEDMLEHNMIRMRRMSIPLL